MQIVGGCYRADHGEFVVYKGEQGQKRRFLTDPDFRRWIEHLHTFLMSDDDEFILNGRVVRKRLTRTSRLPMIQVPIMGGMSVRMIRGQSGGWARFILILPFEGTESPEDEPVHSSAEPVGYESGDDLWG